MPNEIERRIDKSRSRFINCVWPIMGSIVGGGDIISAEDPTAGPLAALLDKIAGIDHWVAKPPLIFGIASRVQNADDHHYKTFTIRYKLRNGARTEYEKRIRQITTSGAVWPHWWCHAYVSPTRDRLIMAAIAHTASVIQSVGSIGYLQTNSYDGTAFWVTPWKELWDTGCAMSIYDNGTMTSRKNNRAPQKATQLELPL